jgi:hypothetical protein
MTSPDSELRKLLQTIATANSLTIYDRVPEQATGNYVHISDINSSDAFTSDQVIWDTELLLDIVTNFDTNKGGRKTADTIGNTLLTALVDKYQLMTGFAIAKSTILNMNYIDEPTDRGYIIRKIIRIELQIESTT